MTEFAFSLHELPPSTNNLFYTSAKDLRRHRSRKYSVWHSSASRVFWFSRGLRLEAPYAVEISGIVPANFDPDNIIKPIVDLLVHNRIIVDDKHIDHTSVDRIAVTMPDQAQHLGSLYVRVWEWRPDAEALLERWIEKMRLVQP